MHELIVDRSVEYFGRIPDWLNESDVSDAGYRMYGHLATRYGGYKKGIFPSQETLAKELNKSIKSIYNAMQELVRVGALQIVQRGLNKTNQYYLAYDHSFNDEHVKFSIEKSILDAFFLNPEVSETSKDIMRKGITRANEKS